MNWWMSPVDKFAKSTYQLQKEYDSIVEAKI